jgi:hypothetical protein
MSSKRVNAILPTAPLQYDPTYLNQLVRTLENLVADVRNPVFSASDLPTEEVVSVLEVGRLYQEGGVVKVVRPEDK